MVMILARRGEELDLEAKAGKTQVLTDAMMHKKAGGWWCDVCECLLRDSANYLDHINGKKHQVVSRSYTHTHTPRSGAASRAVACRGRGGGASCGRDCACGGDRGGGVA